ncbi:MAG: hypothetical protein AMXMBFR33_07370 [Candidatus Xenobia bacterium]
MLGLGGLLGAGGWFLARVSSRRRAACQEAAQKLGLQSVGPDTYRGPVRGIPVELGIGVTVVEGAPLNHLAVVARFITPPEFEFQIAQAGAWPIRHCRLPDDEAFNRVCELQSSTPEQLLALLAFPAVRERVREFIRAGQGCSLVSQHGAVFKVVSAHVGGSAVVLDAINRAVEVVQALSAPLQQEA